MIQIIVDSEETKQALIAESKYVHDFDFQFSDDPTREIMDSDKCNTLMHLHLLPDEAWIIKEKGLFLTKDKKYVKPGNTVWVQGSCGVESSTVEELETLTNYELFGKIPVRHSYASEKEAYKARYGEEKYKKIMKADKKEAAREAKESEEWINKMKNGSRK